MRVDEEFDAGAKGQNDTSWGKSEAAGQGGGRRVFRFLFAWASLGGPREYLDRHRALPYTGV